MKIHKNSFTALAAGLMVVLVASACGDDEEMVDPAPGTATFRVVHASPDGPAVDVYAAGVPTPLITNLSYGEASAYLEVDAGVYDIQVRAAGSDADSAPAYTTGNLTLSDGARITAIASGLLGSTNDADKFRVLPLAEGFGAPASGNAIVRIVHASADAPSVAIDVGNDGTPEVNSLARFADTGASGVELPAAAALQVGIWAGDPLARVTAFTTPELPAGAEIFVIATGLLGDLPRSDAGFSLLAVGPTGAIGFIKQNPAVYALHASPDAPAVDIYAGDSMLSENLAFGQLSSAIQVPPGSYDLDFFATGTGPSITPAASATTPALAAGERYLAVANGFLLRGGDATAFQLIPLADSFDDADSNARVRVIHGSPDAPAVDISTVTAGVMDNPLIASGVEFAGETGGPGLSLPAATYEIGVAAEGAASPLVSFDITATDGLRAFVIAAGALTAGDNEEAFRLLVVNATTTPWSVAEVMPNTN